MMLPLHFTVLTMTGVWCPPKWLATRKKIFYTFYSSIILILSEFLILTQVARILLQRQKFADFNQIFYIVLSTNLASIKAIFNLLIQDRILKLINMFAEYYCIAQNSIETDIRKKCDKHCRILELSILLAMNGTTACIVIINLSGFSDTKSLIYEVLVPYDISKPVLFWMTFIHHSFQSFILTSVSITIDILIASFMLQLCAQLQLLEYRIKALPSWVSKAQSNYVSNENIRKMQAQYMAENIKHHVHILRISEKICSTFKEMVIAQYITSALSISVCIYQISTEKESPMQLLIYCIYLCCMMTQLFIYCYFGNEVTMQSQSLRTSIFHIDWSLLSLEVKKELLIIFIRTSVPIEMFKGVFMTLTLESFINILKKSYSVFTVLKQTV